MNSRFTMSTAMVLSILLFMAVDLLSAREWVDNTGGYRVEAEFVRVAGDKVHLRKENGLVIAVPLARLNEESRAAATALAAAAPAAAMGPDETVLMVTKALGNYQPRVLWDALPASYQKDLEDLLHTFADQTDEESWNQPFAVLNKAAKVMKDKREFILGHPAVLESLPATEEPIDEARWNALADIVLTITASDLADINKVRTLSVGDFLDMTGSKLMRQISDVSKSLEEDSFNDALKMISQTKVRVMSHDGEHAMVQLEHDGETEENGMILVEGKWLPAELPQFWETNIRLAKANIIPEDKELAEQQLQQTSQILQMAEGVLDQLAAAQTQEEFNGVIDGVMALLGGPGEGEGEAPPEVDPFAM